MIIVTPEEIVKFRSELADYPEALTALDVIEQRNGNLAAAAKIIAIRAGYEPSRKSNFWDEWSEKCRKVICQEEFREDHSSWINSCCDRTFGNSCCYFSRSGNGDRYLCVQEWGEKILSAY